MILSQCKCFSHAVLYTCIYCRCWLPTQRPGRTSNICQLEHVSGEIIDDLVATDSMLLQFLINCPFFFLVSTVFVFILIVFSLRESEINRTCVLTYEPRREIPSCAVCATSGASGRPAHTRSLIGPFLGRLHILGLLSC